jgi:amino acid adenylation domain-containing protein
MQKQKQMMMNLSQPLLCRLIEGNAMEHPDALAVSSADGDLTFKELNDRAGQLSHRLRVLGVGPDVPVALFIRSSLEMVIGALGILKAGGAYLPLNPDNPASRTSLILGDSNASVVVTDSRDVHRLPQGDWKIVDIDVPLPPSSLREDLLFLRDSTASDLAYIIYTSGSTGQPKGVQITHANLLNLVSWHCSEFSITSADRATQIAGIGFDAAVWELWPCLAAGASIHIPDTLTRSEPELMRDWLLARDITVCFLPTLMAERIMTLEWPEEAPLRFLLTGADTLNHYPSPGLPFVLVNNYGPTECTVVATSGVVAPVENPTQKPPIGKPIRNARVYVLDEDLQRVPAGSAGQLFVGGEGVARGYVNRPLLTATRFVPDPFSAEPGARMYATGDRGRFLEDGQIEFLGRIDDQIKIRGYRIEPEEIVSTLLRIPEILEAAISVRGDRPEEHRLVAYIVTDPNGTLTYAAIQEFLRERLPDYMVPAVYVVMDRLPVTPNGKVDRSALPDPDDENTMAEDFFEDVESPVETRLKEILIPLLKVTDVGIHSNFFQLGGHSLLGAQVLVRIRESFGVELSLKTIFDHPTVGGISAEIERLILEKLEGIDASTDAQAGNS